MNSNISSSKDNFKLINTFIFSFSTILFYKFINYNHIDFFYLNQYITTTIFRYQRNNNPTMKISTLQTFTFLSSIINLVTADCTLSSDGNYYCESTNAIVYSNVGVSGTYNDVTSMDESTCACSSSSVPFSGSLAPLDEELSVHFRGPLKLKQFGVYYPAQGSSLKKRDSNVECSSVSGKRKHKHKRDVAVEYVEVTATVFVNDKGETVTNQVPAAKQTTVGKVLVGDMNVDDNNNNSPKVTNAAGTTPIAVTTTEVAPVAAPSSSSKAAAGSSSSKGKGSSKSGSSSSSSSSSSSFSSSSSSSSGSYSSGSWIRETYYQPGSTTNCTFMNHMGGSAGSGVWSSCFGDSISYAASNGIDGAGSAFALDDVTLPSGQEYMIFSGVECNGNDCGYYRDGIPAYHGFGGDQKIFVFEFQMPTDNSGSSGINQDMPAIWLLNAKIPRTLQYGNSDCSCWGTGCGEMDLFEILSAGSDKLISHIHDAQGSGSQDYFKRPVDSTLKAAVIFNGSDKTIHIVEVDDDFSSTLSADTVNSWLEKSGSSAALP